MPRVIFTTHLQKHVDAPPQTVDGATVQEALSAVFADHPGLRGYILDDQSCVRKHVMIFLDDAPIKDRETLQDPVRPDSEIYVMQALSGG